MILLSSFLALIIIIQAGVVINANRTVLKEVEKISLVDVPLLNYTHELKLSVVQVQQWLTDISATRGLDGLNDGFDEAEINAKHFRELIIKITELDKDNTSSYKNMSVAFEQYYEAGKTMAQAYIDQGPAGGNLTMANFDDAAEAIYSKVNPLLEEVQSNLNKAQSMQHDAADFSRIFAFWGLGIVLISLIFITFNVIKSIRKIPNIVAEMATADLNKRFEGKGNNEISEIVVSLQIMRDRLLKMVDNISGSTHVLAQDSDELAALAVITNQNIQQQFSETEQVATAMNEMTISAQEVANTIALTSDAAREANDITTSGQLIVDQATTQINALASQIEEASETIYQLEQDSISITSVLNVIKSIAEQTNLLALNAAIEAARAGEQGRGFAVVADEVRTLASRTQKSTEEVNTMLDKLLLGSKKAVEVMGKSKEQAESAVHKVSDTGESLSRISKAVENINDMSAQISSAAGQQSSVAEEINQNIVRINDMSTETLTHIEQLNVSSQDIAKRSTALKNVVEQFNS
jgi:methyl-accepting chemotaxis protein